MALFVVVTSATFTVLAGDMIGHLLDILQQFLSAG